MKLACIQITSTASVTDNIAMIEPMLHEAAQNGATLIALPENAFLMASGRQFHEQVTTEAEHSAIAAAKIWAKELGIWLIIGSIAVKVPSSNGESAEDHNHTQKQKYANRQLVISPKGTIAARYDKIHLFDVSVPGGESHQESARFIYGDKAVTTPANEAILGLSICYDVRFAYLYRALAKAGANILTIPAAFTRFTGEKGGWHVLCRARAMETGCFVIAPAQCGSHSADRKTYGHSLIINPWGEVLAEGDDKPGIISAEIDLAEVTQTRQIMPSLMHDREFDL